MNKELNHLKLVHVLNIYLGIIRCQCLNFIFVLTINIYILLYQQYLSWFSTLQIKYKYTFFYAIKFYILEDQLSKNMNISSYNII